MKKCPFCAEQIQDEALKCRYCGELLTEELRKAYVKANKNLHYGEKLAEGSQNDEKNKTNYSANLISKDGSYLEAKIEAVSVLNAKEIAEENNYKVVSISSSEQPPSVYDEDAYRKITEKRSRKMTIVVVVASLILWCLINFGGSLFDYFSKAFTEGSHNKSSGISGHPYYSKEEVRTIARNTGASEDRVRETIASLPAGTPRNWEDFDN